MTSLSEATDTNSSDISLSDLNELYIDTPEQLSPRYILPQSAFRDDSFHLFLTNSGYQAGHILGLEDNKYQVILCRNELGEEIYNGRYISKSALVIPHRKCSRNTWIAPYKKNKNKLIAEGFVRAQQPFRLGYGMGSGISGKLYSERTLQALNLSKNQSKYKIKLWPIYTPLTLHNMTHRHTLTQLARVLEQSINQYIQNSNFDRYMIYRVYWLLNVILYVDRFPHIPINVMIETLVNFCADYVNMPKNTVLEHPINYILRPLHIDGICVTNEVQSPRFSVSFITNDFENIIYRTLK